MHNNALFCGQMNLDIHDKTVLITGAGRGLGKAMAHSFSREGARVILCSRTKVDLESALENLPDLGKQHSFFSCDLSDENGPKDLFNFLAKNNLIPDIVVHNVGGNLNITDPLCSLSDWRNVFRINLEVAIELNQMIIPFMKKKHWGRICHVASISGLENQGPPSYCAAKAALIAYVRSLGRYVAKDGIVITSILPGAVFTEGGYWDEAAQSRPEHVKKYLSERMAIGRFGKPEEISEIVTFLCSSLSSFCIGSAILSDGGQGKVFFSQE